MIWLISFQYNIKSDHCYKTHICEHKEKEKVKSGVARRNYSVSVQMMGNFIIDQTLCTTHA